jgi:tetratricopeptide (TPR) repeat protein
MKGAFDRAAADCERALRLDPNNVLALHCRGLLYDRRKDHARAIADFTRAIQLAPNDASLYTNRARAYLSNGELDKAAEDCDRAVRLDSNQATAYACQGEVYRQQHKYDEAADAWARAIALDPKDGWAYDKLAWLQATCPEAEQRDGAKAVEYATRACELSGWKDAERLATLAAAHAECGRFAEARRWQAKALALADERQQEFYRHLAGLYGRGQPYREARPEEP